MKNQRLSSDHWPAIRHNLKLNIHQQETAIDRSETKQGELNRNQQGEYF